VPRRLLAVNVLLVAAALVSAALVVRELRTPAALPLARTRTATPEVAAAARAETPPAPATYGSVAARNLFSPTRTEAPPTPVASTPAATLARPSLHGVVLRDGAPIAYLEDPTTKRVAGYRLGDAIAGGSVQAIAADHVVIARPDGKLDVRLRDPSRPRAAPPVTPVGQPGTQPGQRVTQPPGLAPGPVQPGAVQAPPQVPIPGRRPLPPNLLRRVPPTNDATNQP
jgi:hypothetical protein